MAKNKILLVDDEEAVRFGIRAFLEAKGFEVAEADSCRAAQEALGTFRPDVVVLDYSLPDGNALQLLPQLKRMDASLSVVILTAHASIDLAVRAIKEGADQFLTKPLELPALVVILERLLENQRNQKRQLAGKTRQARNEVDPFRGSSAAIGKLREAASRLTSSESPILIQGETGTGKGVLATWLYQHSPRSEEAFVDLNCAGLNAEFLETELFGHEKGAFTGAASSKLGLLEVAHRGTVFLDEVGDVDPIVQPKLLKVLEEKRFRRLGDVRDRQVDIRLIAATHQDLSALIREKKFRSDLYFRINTLPLMLPALRERREDVPLIARHLLQGFTTELGRREVSLSHDAEEALQAYQWPGNIRELRNVLERALLLSDRAVLGRQDLHFEASSVAPEAPSTPLDMTLAEMERWHVERVLREEGGRVDQASRRLGVPRSSLYQKIKKFGIAVSKV